MSQYNQKRFCELLEQLVEGKCNCDYCFLKIYFETIHPDPRVLMQMKCVEKFKWEQSEKIGKDIGWEEACFLWVDLKWAAAFNKVFNEDLPISELYDLTKKMVEKV